MDCVLEIEKNGKSDGLSDMLAFVGLPTKGSSRELSGSNEELFKGIIEILNNLLLRAIEARTAVEFEAARDEIFEPFRKTIRAMSSLANVVIPVRTLERLSWEVFAELEAELTQNGSTKFGLAARDQAIFTLWTLRNINRFLAKIAVSAPVAKESEARDREIAREFSFYSGWAQFHLECLIAAMRFNKPIHPGVLDLICDGLRSVVNAYGLIRQGADLRQAPLEEQEQLPYKWGQEDQELLDSSMADMEEMESEEY